MKKCNGLFCGVQYLFFLAFPYSRDFRVEIALGRCRPRAHALLSLDCDLGLARRAVASLTLAQSSASRVATSTARSLHFHLKLALGLFFKSELVPCSFKVAQHKAKRPTSATSERLPAARSCSASSSSPAILACSSFTLG
jgi:hypothetical protein